MFQNSSAEPMPQNLFTRILLQLSLLHADKKIKKKNFCSYYD